VHQNQCTSASLSPFRSAFQVNQLDPKPLIPYPTPEGEGGLGRYQQKVVFGVLVLLSLGWGTETLRFRGLEILLWWVLVPQA
jgi:hypothetical protein